MQHSLESREGFAEMLCELFAYANVTNRQVAKLLEVNEKTIRNWLDGYSEPDPSTLIKLFRLLNVPMIPFIMDRTIIAESDERERILNYINNTASQAELRDMNFNVNCKHGSSVASQLSLVSMLNHMKLEYRLLIAKMVLNLWEIASSADGLQHTDEAMPDVEKVLTAVKKSHIALKEGMNSYTDI